MKTTALISVPCVLLSVTLGAAWAQNAPKVGGEAPAAGADAEPKKPPPGGVKAAPEAHPVNPQAAPKAGGTADKSPKPPGTGAPAEPGRAAPASEGKAAPAKPEQAPANVGTSAKPGTQKPAVAARPAPKLSAEQRTRVVEVVKRVDVAPVHVDFAVNVGVAVPRTVVLHPLPPEFVTIVPDYEGYEFFLVAGDIVVVDPDSLEIVAVLPI